MIECLPTCCDVARPVKYAPITYGDYVAWWYDSNYAVADQEDVRVEA